MTPVAPCMVNNVSYITKIKYVSRFACQAQYLVRLEGDTCCSTDSK